MPTRRPYSWKKKHRTTILSIFLQHFIIDWSCAGGRWTIAKAVTRFLRWVGFGFFVSHWESASSWWTVLGRVDGSVEELRTETMSFASSSIMTASAASGEVGVWQAWASASVAMSETERTSSSPGCQLPVTLLGVADKAKTRVKASAGRGQSKKLRQSLPSCHQAASRNMVHTWMCGWGCK